jgi:hypothetical protein
MRKNPGLAILLAISVVAAALVIGYRKVPVVHAQDKGCDATTVTGAYGYTLSGTVYDNYGYIYMLGAAGRMVSDGNGNLTGTDTLSFDGTIAKRQYTGTYTMNADCTGSLTLTMPGGGTMHADIVAVNNGKELNMVQTDTAYIVTAVLKQQSQ